VSVPEVESAPFGGTANLVSQASHISMLTLLLRRARPRRPLPAAPWPAAAAGDLGRRRCAAAGAAAAGDGAGPIVDELLDGVLRRRDRGAVARAITLCESRAPADWAAAAALLRALAAAAPAAPAALRVGVCGPPGAGKSALIDALGCALADAGRRPAVLCVDPSSSLGAGGSILGDKARMAALSSRAGAFVRPSPSRGALGGLGRATHEAVAIVEAAGYDRVLIETVGLGQSETHVAAVADVSLLCLPSTGGGDGLQALKRGIMEAADVVAITKVDGPPAVREAALRAAADARGALGLQRRRRGGWAPRVLLCSARTGEGLPELLAALDDFEAAARASGALAEHREAAAARLLALEAESAALDALRADGAVAAALAAGLASSPRPPLRVIARDALQQFRPGQEQGGGGGG